MDEKIRVLRVSEDSHKLAKKTSEKNHMTLTGFTERAIKLYVSELENTYQNLIEMVSKQPLLNFNKKVISEIFREVDKENISEAVHILKNENVKFYDLTKEDFLKNINTFNKKVIECTFIMIRANPTHKPDNEFDELIESSKKLKVKKCRHIRLHFDHSIKEKFKIALFIKFEKEEGEDDKND